MLEFEAPFTGNQSTGIARKPPLRPGSWFGRCLVATFAVTFMYPACGAIAATQEKYPCRQKLSKKGAMIFNEVQEKRSVGTNLEEIWKEVTRDLITANLLGREEATSPAMEALSCLRDPE